jgi:hypothetical protein
MVDGVGGLPHPSHFTSGKGTWYPQGQSGWAKKILPPPGFSLQTVKHVGSRYTDHAILALYVDVCVTLLVNCVLGLVVSAEDGSSLLLRCTVLFQIFL